MISTKINVDTSELLKAFKLLESQGKLTADNIDKAFNNSLKIEVDSSDFKKIETEATTMFGKLKNNLKGSFDMSQILNFSAGGLVTGAVEKGLSLVAEGFSQAIEKGSEFEKQLNAVGAITGQSGEALDKIGESALELSKTFGGDANTQLGAFQGILSKFGAELANTPEALNEVTKNVNLLAKASGMDATQSMNALTDAMLQFGVDTTNADEVAKESARFMNLLAASAKVGAAEIPELTASMLQVGVSAKSANISAEEVTGALQRLAVGGKKGSEAGIGLRNVLGLLQKQSGEGEKILGKMGLTTLKLGESLGKDGLAKTLDLVKNGLNNFGSQTEKNQAILQLFGAENSTVAGLLLENTKQITEFTKASTGTASGLEQAKINMQGFSESMSRLKSNIDAGLIKSFMVVKQAIADVFVFIKPLLDLWYELFQATTLTLWGNIFSTVFGIVKKTFMDTYNSVKEIVDIFRSMFGEAESGIDIIGILATTFEFLGRYIGTLVTLPFQALHKILQGVLYVVKELILFVKGLGDRFNDFVNSNKMVSDFVEAVTEKFRQLGKWISESAKSVKGFLQSIGLLSKDKSTDNITKNFEQIDSYKRKYIDLQKESSNLTYKELKAKQDALANEINNEVKLGKIKSANAEELKKKIYEIGIANKKTEETTDTGGTTKAKKVKIKAEAEIETFEVTEVPLLETNNISIRPKTLTIGKPIKPILIEIEESETEKMFKNLAKSLTDGFSKIDYTSIFKKKETAFDESLNEDRANLLTSLQQNELSYEEYAERLNEIDRNRRETQKEGNSEFIQGLNDTLAVAFEGVNTTVNDTLDKSVSKLAELDENSQEYSKGMTDSITLAMLSIGTATAEMALQGGNLLKELALNTIKTARAMFNAYLAPLLLKELTKEIFAPLAFAKLAGYQILGNSLLSIAEGFAMQLKDGAININGAGTSTSDSIPAMLSKGESVINARSTAQNEPYLRFINNGGDMSKLVNMNMNTKNIENLLYTNNELLRSKNLISNVNVNNKFEVANSGINVKIKR